MKILVTGAAGKVGTRVMHELLDNGHQVRALDITGVAPELHGRVEMVYEDISNRLAMLRAAQGCDGIAHLAAITYPTRGRELEIFEPNVVGTHYVLAAAEAHGISRVALASSCSIYGAAFAKNPFEWEYLPIDEAHPQKPEDLYAVSKAANEQTAAVFSRRAGMATTCLRLSWVIDFKEQNRWMRRMLDNADGRRSSDLWGYIEVRDVARAFRLALERVESGHHTPLIVARDVWARRGVRDLVAEHYPEFQSHLDGAWDFEKFGCYDTRPAEELFGFVAEHLWRDNAELSALAAETV